MPHLLIVSGAPAAGKSTVAGQLCERLRWPLLAKDMFKETLFDALGCGDRPWSRRLSHASYKLMFAAADELLRCGVSCVLEGNFRGDEQLVELRRLVQLPDVSIAQVFCWAPPSVTKARLVARVTGELRHPGHLDALTLDELQVEASERPYQPLALEGPLWRVDTSSAIEDEVTQVVGELLC